MSAGWDDGSADHRFRVVPAVYLLLRREGQVLLQLRAGTGFMDGYWAAGAAGHVEPDESVLEAAVREAREELGVAVAPSDLEALTVSHRGLPGGPALEQRVDFFFAVSRWQGDPVLQEPDKAADLRWFPFVHLPEPVVPHELAVLRALHDGAVPRITVRGFGGSDADA
ncbi:ADP-ribose pyrophosphatase YjhB (NUDIX family) [Isoptericola sp. CG 20/1183]|uniref:ADP-ribose pyrophosphatase YjhB (NUDIX family) n=1 Tax=Isoptericola halotolerans TaxID=300560 RepID=A0ABX5ECK0_9MICO|nr:MULTISPECIES: NUDIX domain-containing protein [Isoptericola]PRZ05561.1 ADP-ribose pyrophosphatase YjhB (NUDIX family) [Isoptericola halotolerans]PRZ06129.1 ADP-ribose pyrophosphatase YjhB (NUDIX family) [Isoptericola sp. CG 20/1183]